MSVVLVLRMAAVEGESAKSNALENNTCTKARTNSKGDDQRPALFVATGFIDVSSEDEVKDFIENAVMELNMKESLETLLFCLSDNPTLSTVQNKRHNRVLRTAHRKQYIKDEGNIRSTLNLGPQERDLQKQLCDAKCYFNPTCKIHITRINREQ